MTTLTPAEREALDTVTGAVVRTERRDVFKDGKPVLKANGKPRQELVVTTVVAAFDPRSDEVAS